ILSPRRHSVATRRDGMALVAVGLNHLTAPLEFRERVAFAPGDTASALAALTAEPGVKEAAILSTCNRTELYCTVEGGAETTPAAWLQRHHQLTGERLGEFLYLHTDADAVRHLFRVATGLESMVLGEPQILGQVKDAYALAREAHTLNAPLERLFQNTFQVAKRVRSDTRIGANPVSVAFTAADLPRHLAEADVVIASTASREPVLDRDTVAAALAQRRRKPMFLVDIAVPRDIDPSVATIEDAFLYTIDDLREVIDENLRSRREAA